MGDDNDNRFSLQQFAMSLGPVSVTATDCKYQDPKFPVTALLVHLLIFLVYNP